METSTYCAHTFAPATISLFCFFSSQLKDDGEHIHIHRHGPSRLHSFVCARVYWRSEWSRQRNKSRNGTSAVRAIKARTTLNELNTHTKLHSHKIMCVHLTLLISETSNLALNSQVKIAFFLSSRRPTIRTGSCNYASIPVQPCVKRLAQGHCGDRTWWASW